MEGREFSRQNEQRIDEASETLFQKRSGCCFCFPCFDSFGGGNISPSPSPTVGLKWWQKIKTAEVGSNNSLWIRGVSGLKKIREWSEIVAGPRWKTFIRRFNRSNSRHVNFQYDPLTYAMNFDEGPGQNGHFDDEDDGAGGYYSRNFSTRYANSSMNLDNDGPTFV